MDANTARQLVVLGTGGTIAGRAQRADDNVGYTAAQVAVGDLLAGLPALAAARIETEQVAQVNSKDMTLAVWQSLVRRVGHHLARPEVAGIVITHGTDTIEETAFLLQTLLQPAKPVVLTCAMRPATAVSPDGPQNLSDAVAVAGHAGARGVVVVCAGRVHDAHDVAKVHGYRTDPFDSGDAGPVAVVEEGVVRVFRPWPQGSVVPGALDAFLAAQALPRVIWLTSHAAADAWAVDALLRGGPGLAGIVVAGTGNGSLHESLQAALHRAQAQGVRVALASRCGGRIVPYPAQPFDDRAGLAPAKARLALALECLAG